MLPVAHGSPLSIGKRYYGELNSPRSWYHSFLSPGLAAASEMISSLPDAPLLYFPAPSRLDFPLERFYKKFQSDGWIYFDHGADEGLHIHRNPLPQKTTVFYASTVKINITKAHYGSDLIMPQCQKNLNGSWVARTLLENLSPFFHTPLQQDLWGCFPLLRPDRKMIPAWWSHVS